MNILESLESLNVSESCFNSILSLIEEEISQKDIEGARKRKLARLETIGKSLDKKYHKAQADFEKAEQAEANAQNMLAPRVDQVASYIHKGQEVPKATSERYNRKYIGLKQAQAAKREAEKKASDALDKSLENKKVNLQVRGYKG